MNDPWTGRARYAMGREEPVWPAPLTTAVRCRFEGVDQETSWALFDTGAQWSMIGGDEARRLHGLVGAGGTPMTMATRLGRFDGTLERLRVAFVAEIGADLELEASALLAPDWTGPPVIGMRGLLEYVGFELNPEINGDEHWWSFANAQPR
jgi:hypothetical protein